MQRETGVHGEIAKAGDNADSRTAGIMDEVNA